MFGEVQENFIAYLVAERVVDRFKFIEIHKEDLMVDWELAVQGDEPFRIPPLQ